MLRLPLALAAALAAGCVIHETIEHQTIDVAPACDALDIELDAGDVSVIGADTNKVHIEVTRDYTGSARPSVNVYPLGDALTLRALCPSVVHRCRADVEITGPRDLDVHAFTGAGDIVVRGMTGEIDVESGAGEVDLHGPMAPTTATTGAGDIVATAIWTDWLEASTGAGAIELVHLVPPERVVASSGAGDISLLVPSGSYDVCASSGLGWLDLRGVVDDPRSDRLIDAHTGVGDITITGFRPYPDTLPTCSAEDGDPWEIRALRIEGDDLIVETRVTGGCRDHDWTLCWPEPGFMKSLPAQTRLDLLYDSNDDPCDAIVDESRAFDLVPLRDAYRHLTQDQHATIVVHVGPLSADYRF